MGTGTTDLSTLLAPPDVIASLAHLRDALATAAGDNLHSLILYIDGRPDLSFVDTLAENHDLTRHSPILRRPPRPKRHRLRRTLGVPLVYENISALFGWPDAEMTSSFTCRQQAVI